MVLTCRQMQDLEEAAFARGVSAESLMEEAGAQIAKAILQFFPKPGAAILYLGKGNNAGDALVAARFLHQAGWQIYVRPAFEIEAFKPLPAKHWQTLQAWLSSLKIGETFANLSSDIVLLDGLLGIGASGSLRGDLAKAAEEMNQLRKIRHAVTFALDLPSGLDSNTGVPGDVCVEADFTIAIAHAKTCLLEDAAVSAVGRLIVAPLRELSGAQDVSFAEVLTVESLLPTLPRRSFDFHKGKAGRVGLIAGSPGFLGAAILASTGALRGGAGLVTLYVKEDIYPLIAVQTSPEIMVKKVKSYREVLDDPLDALAIGPGLGKAHDDEILEVIAAAEVPLILDADALNILARNGLKVLQARTKPTLLTPHPGEMARLAEHLQDYQRGDSRRKTSETFNSQFPAATLLLKGSRTIISEAKRPVSFNTTGNAGMASGGMGDVLTGLCAALVGQKVDLYEAACLGAWLSGRAAEIAVAEKKQSQESLVAHDVLDHLGAAFADLKRQVF